MLPGSGWAQQLTFDSQQTFSSAGEMFARPQLAASETNVYLLYTASEGASSRLLLRRSSDGGRIFADPIDVGATAGLAGSANAIGMAAGDGGDVFIVSSQVGAGEDSGLYFLRSTDAGQSFDTSIPLSAAASSPDITADGNEVYVYYVDTDQSADPPISDAFFYSNDGGLNFGPVSKHPRATDGGKVLDLAAAGGRLHTVWARLVDTSSASRETEYYVRVSSDGAQTFDASVPLDVSDSQGGVRIAAVGSRVQVAWDHQELNEDGSIASQAVRHATSTDGGGIFSAPTDLSSGTFAVLRGLAAAGETVIAGWTGQVDPLGPSPELFARASGDSGAAFGGIAEVQAGGVEGFPGSGSVSATDSAVHVALGTNSPSSSGAIFYARADLAIPCQMEVRLEDQTIRFVRLTGDADPPPNSGYRRGAS